MRKAFRGLPLPVASPRKAATTSSLRAKMTEASRMTETMIPTLTVSFKISILFICYVKVDCHDLDSCVLH